MVAGDRDSRGAYDNLFRNASLTAV